MNLRQGSRPNNTRSSSLSFSFGDFSWLFALPSLFLELRLYVFNPLRLTFLAFISPAPRPLFCCFRHVIPNPERLHLYIHDFCRKACYPQRRETDTLILILSSLCYFLDLFSPIFVVCWEVIGSKNAIDDLHWPKRKGGVCLFFMVYSYF